MSKYIFESNTVNGSVVIGDNAKVNIHTSLIHKQIMEELYALQKTIDNSTHELNTMIDKLQIALTEKNTGKFTQILSDGKDFLLQLSANFSANCLEYLMGL